MALYEFSGPWAAVNNHSTFWCSFQIIDNGVVKPTRAFAWCGSLFCNSAKREKQ
jgi:hypothetical protein